MKLHNEPSLERADDRMRSIRHMLNSTIFFGPHSPHTSYIRMKTFHPFALLHVKIFNDIFYLNEALRSPYPSWAHTRTSRSNNLRKPTLLLIVAEQIGITHKMSIQDFSAH